MGGKSPHRAGLAPPGEDEPAPPRPEVQRGPAGQGHHDDAAGPGAAVNGPPPGTLGRDFYDRSPLVVAPELLGKVLIGGDGRRGRITEVEAYCGADDPASHAYRGRTRRNGTMWGPCGHLYVYFSYGMHWCANATCGPEGVAGAVLLRAMQPLEGLEAMRRDRWRHQRHPTDRDLCRGPARLCQAMGWDRTFDGADLVTAEVGVAVADDGAAPPEIQATTRIGLSVATDRPWRWIIAGSRWVSG